MTGGGEVAADLVGDAGVNDDIEEGEFLAGLEGGPGGGGGEAVACGYFVGIADEGHFAGGARLVGEGGIEPAGSVHDAVDEGGVVFLDGQVAELGTEGGVGRGGLGGENEAGGLRVEAMQQGREEAVVADIGRRRGNVIAMSMRGTVRSVIGEVPLAEARGYATALRSLTQGRGAFSLEFERYDFVPDSMAEEITRQRQIDGKVATR